MDYARLGMVGVVSIVFLGMLLAGCVSGGGQGSTTTTSGSQIEGVNAVPTISEEELNIPSVEEEAGLSGEIT